MTIEKRFETDMEIRAESQGDSGEMWVTGYALKFNKPSQELRSNGIKFIETINPNSFTENNLDDLRLLSEHDHTRILARASAGNLETEIDEIGLKFRAKLANTSYARDMYENLKVGNVSACSFGFEIADKGDSIRYNKEKKVYERTLNTIKRISEITLTSMPAYKDTNVGVAVRNIEEFKEQEAEQIKQQHKRKLELELDLLKLKLEGDLYKQ